MIDLTRLKARLGSMDGLRGLVRDADSAVRQQAAERAAVAQNAREYGIVQGLSDRMSAETPDVESVEKQIRSYLPGEEGAYLKQLKSRAKGADKVRQSIYESAAMNSEPGLVQQLNERLAGTSGMDRAVQAATYGSIGGGVTLGLTAAGQGLMALMEFIGSGEEQGEARNSPLV